MKKYAGDMWKIWKIITKKYVENMRRYVGNICKI